MTHKWWTHARRISRSPKGGFFCLLVLKWCLAEFQHLRWPSVSKFFLTQVPFVEGPSSPFSLKYDLSNHYIIMLFLKHGRQFVPLLTSAKINQYLKVHPNGHNEDDWYKANQNCHYNFSILHIFSISLILVWRYIHPTTHTMQVNPNLASQSI